MSFEIKEPQTPSVSSSETASTVGSEVPLRKRDIEGEFHRNRPSLRQYLLADVDPGKSSWQMAGYCFMTGYIDVVSFSAIFAWCGLQTGNYAQLAVALARLFEGPPGHRDKTFHRADQQALTSFISFNIGSCVGRIGDRIGAHKRIWLIGGTFLQALFTMAAAIAFWKAGEPGIASGRSDGTWTNVLSFVGLAFISMSLGLQGLQGKRLNTHFGATIVLTTIWLDLSTDPSLLKIGKMVKSRDHRLMAVSALFLGVFTSRAILAQTNTACAMGVAVGFRVLISLSWFFVPNKTAPA